MADAQPYGIDRRHLDPPPRTAARVALTVFIGAPILAAVTGWLGGGPAEQLTASTAEATLSVEQQAIVRSGNWFETRVSVVPRRDVADLTIAVDERLWQRMSIDTLAPDAEKGTFDSGTYRYSFGPIAAGERFVVKLDGQIQSWGLRRLAGEVKVLDGERPLARVPVRLTVLP